MDRFTGRRKLLRGSLSAPVVLTVASPGALAQTSFTACIARGAGATPDPYVTQDDGFVRRLVSAGENAGKYELVYFNENGEPVGYGAVKPTNGEPVTDSCWGSFNGVNPP